METHKIEFYPSRGINTEEKKIYKLLGEAWPIQPAVDFKPSWHAKLNKTYQRNSESPPEPTAKSCPGIFDYMRAGYIVPMWSDICFRGHEDSWDALLPHIITDNIPKMIEMHDHQQAEGAPFLEDGCSALVKLNSPWYVNVPKGVSLLLTSPFYHINSEFTVMPGMIDADMEYSPNREINCFIKLNKPSVRLVQGQPLLQIIPFVRADYEFKNNVPAPTPEHELDILNVRHKTEIAQESEDPTNKLQRNRTPKKYNV